MPCTATGPCSSASSTGVPTAPASVRRWTPAASMSRLEKPSRCAESWLPLVTTTLARDRASRTKASSASRTASTGGSARS
jgi:hypothetical protein